jgi:hypothetical protein
VPVALEGRNQETNLALACRSCNLLKSAFVTGFDGVNQEMVRLFHPREDGWEDHFCVEQESGEIVGLTSTGRATITRLQMNHELQRAARRQWMRLGLFP